MMSYMKIHELGHVVLYVTNLERSTAFYRDTLGFPMISTGNGFSAFATGRNHHEMLLIEIGEDGIEDPSARPASDFSERSEGKSKAGVQPRYEVAREKHFPEPGLYHIGFKIGDGPEVAKAVYKELKEKNVPIIGTTDHGVTHSIYILDPDGNELELYADVSDAWKTNPTAIMSAPKRLDLE